MASLLVEMVPLLLLLLPITAASTSPASTAVATADPAAELQAKIDGAIAAGAPSLAVEAGDYHFGNRTLLIENATDFALLAAGPVQFIFWQHRGGVVVRSCTNVTISGQNATGMAGIVVDRSPPPYAQGLITGEHGGFVEFELEGDSADPWTLSGDLDPTDHWPNGSSGVMTTGWRKGSVGALPDSRGQPTGIGRGFDPRKMVPVAGGSRRFRVGTKGELGGARVGDQFIMTVRPPYTAPASASASASARAPAPAPAPASAPAPAPVR